MPKPAKKRKNAKASKEIKETYGIYFVHYVYCLGTIVLLILASYNLNNLLKSRNVLGASVEVNTIQDEKEYWLKVASENPTYVDAYLQLAKVEVELSNKDAARSYIDEAKKLNPNSEEIEIVGKELGL